ncbi:MAG: caspase family protein [Cyclobacteriaceae bacterium]
MKKWILLSWLIVSYVTLCYSQDVELVLQSGHGLQINDIEYSPDGTKIATCSEDFTIKIWEIATGKEMTTMFGHTKAVNDLAFAPDSKTLVSVGDDNKVIIWEVESGKSLKVISDHKNKVLGVDYSLKGDYFATCGMDKVVLLHNVASGKIKELYEFNSEVNRVKFLNSGDYLYAETDKLLSKNAFFSIPQGKMVTWIPGGGATSISFDSEDKKFMVGRVQYGTPTISIIKDWNMITDWKKSKEPLWKSLYPYNFQDTTGSFKILPWQKQDNYDINNVDTDIAKGMGSEVALSVFFSEDGKNDIIAANQFGEILWWKYDDIKFFPRTANPYAKLNEKMGNMYATPYKLIKAHRSPILDAVSSSDGKYIFSSAENGEMKLWDTDLMRNIQTFTSGAVLPMYAASFGADAKTMILSTGLKDRHLIELSSMEIIESFEMEEIIERYAFSNDRSKVLMGFYNSSFFHLINMKTKEVLRTFKGHLGEITSLSFSEDESNAISTASEGKRITWSLSSGDIINNEVIGKAEIASAKNSSSLEINKIKTVVTLNSDDGISELTHLNKITSWGYTPDEKYAFTASMDGSIALWNPKSGENVAKIMVTKDKEVIAITPDYYFLASKNALKGIAFKYNGRMYPFEQFDLQLNRPDIVLERIGYADTRLVRAYNAAFKKRQAQLGIPDEGTINFNVPIVDVDLARLPRSTSSRNYKFTVTGSDDKEELSSILVKVNGVPLSQIKAEGKQVTKEINVDLSTGDNKVEVSLINSKGISSLVQSFEVDYINDSPKRDLYLITVGVSKYANQDFNLTYATKDAGDINELLRSQSEMFENIHHLNYLDNQATPENIAATKSKLGQSKIDDYVIFFFAGHGLLDKNLDYYLGAHNINFSNPSDGGLSYESVQNLMGNINARNKLILIDACHSGELEKQAVTVSNTSSNLGGKLSSRGFTEVQERTGVERIIGFGNLFKFMKSQFADLRENTGAIVISSAGGAEFAFESDKWKNGVFTFFLKQGLYTKEADLNGDGSIYASELQRYLSEKVYEATDGKQRPTTRAENLNYDMLLYK